MVRKELRKICIEKNKPYVPWKRGTWAYFFRFFLWKLMISSFRSLIAVISSSVAVNSRISSTLQSSIRHNSLRVLELIGSPCPILLNVFDEIPQ